MSTKTQPMAALEAANAVRSERAKLKRKLRGGELKFEDLDPERIETMRVMEVLRALPWRGPIKSTGTMARTDAVRPAKILQTLRIPQQATVGQVVRAGRWERLGTVVRRANGSQR